MDDKKDILEKVENSDFEKVKEALVKYRVALQPNKQVEIWIKLCKTFNELFDSNIRKIFEINNNDVEKIRKYIQQYNKAKFPYLSGNKIFDDIWSHHISISPVRQ